jgi:hypothetical protein
MNKNCTDLFISYPKIMLLLLLALTSSLAYAFDITGRIASATDDTPLAGATLRLLSLPDSTFLGGVAADAEGRFTLTTSKVKRGGRYTIAVSYVGFTTTYVRLEPRDLKKPYELHDVHLNEESHRLGETVVSAVPPPMVVRGDTVEYFADSYKTQPGADAEALLEQLPGVEVEADGSLTAQGKKVEQVYVDGKEFFGNNTQIATKNLTADMIESVQVVDMQNEESRQSGIDDGERRKVINLKLKPKMRRGWFGNARGAWGNGHNITDRYTANGMAGYFRGNLQGVLVAGANNTNNAGFGDQGDGVMSGSSMRGNRNSGERGNGIQESWQVGVNVNYDEADRIRDVNTPLAAGGDLFFGGSNQDEVSSTHRINYRKGGNTVADSHSADHNESRNMRLNLNYERTFGAQQQHNLSIKPNLTYNNTRTSEGTESATYYEDQYVTVGDSVQPRYISQTRRSSNMEQEGLQYGLEISYRHKQKTEHGTRRSSVALSVSGRTNDGDHYVQSLTGYDTVAVADLTLQHDTAINQWQEERAHSETYRLRLSHIEPLAEGHNLEFSVTTALSNRYSRQLYHFWNNRTQQYEDSVGARSSADYNAETLVQNLNTTLRVGYNTVQPNYNLTVGVDFMPQMQDYEDRCDHRRDYHRHYVNYAPRIVYRYRWTQDRTLRITYRGQTQQPSMNQLQASKNQVSATHVRLGNPDLEPSFSHNLEVRWVNYLRETQQSYEATLTAASSFNTLTSRRWYSEDLRTDTTRTENLSGLGDWEVEGGFLAAIPFADNHWYVSTQTRGGYTERIGYANVKNTDSELNHTRTTTLRQNFTLRYRTERMNLSLSGNYRWQYAAATVLTTGNLGTTQTYGGRFSALYRFPWDVTLSSDVNYTARRGYSAGIKRNTTLWNAQLSKVLYAKKNLTAYVKVFDLLRQKSSITRSITATAMTDRESNVLGQYFLAGLSMTFKEMDRGRNNRRGGNRGSEGGGRAPRGEL